MRGNIKIAHTGFSLTQLMVSLAVIGILAAIMIPVISGVIQRTNTVTCASNMRQMYNVLMLYRADNRGYFPPGHFVPREEQGGVRLRDHLVPDYLPELLYCPEMRLTQSGRDRWPNEDARLKVVGSYSINYFLLRTHMENLPGPHWGGHPYPGDSRMVFLVETTFSGASWANTHPGLALSGYPQVHIQPRSHGNHNLNFLFLDGRVEQLAPVVTGVGTVWNSLYDWSEIFESWGRNGKLVPVRNVWNDDFL